MRCTGLRRWVAVMAVGAHLAVGITTPALSGQEGSDSEKNGWVGWAVLGGVIGGLWLLGKVSEKANELAEKDRTDKAAEDTARRNWARSAAETASRERAQEKVQPQQTSAQTNFLAPTSLIIQRRSVVSDRAIRVLHSPDQSARTILVIPPGEKITIQGLTADRGWSLIGRDGQTLGYARADSFSSIQPR